MTTAPRTTWYDVRMKNDPAHQPITWELLQQEVIFHKYSQTIVRRDFRQPNDAIADYYIRIQKSGACVLGITPDNKVLTVTQFRPGPMRILRELPGGQIDDTETAQTTAVRELLEETGYAGELVDWSGSWETDAYTQCDRTVVIVKNCRKVAEPQMDSHEFGIVEAIDMEAFIVHARSGQLSDTAGALLALDHLGLLR